MDVRKKLNGEILNAILYVLRSGCPWRLLPHDLPRWFTAYWYFRQWKRAGIWEQVNAALRRDLRVQNAWYATVLAKVPAGVADNSRKAAGLSGRRRDRRE